jgi:hypothetical protein
MTLKDIETQLKRWSDRTYIGWYSLIEDSEFIRLLVNGADKPELLEHLQNTYPDYFEED